MSVRHKQHKQQDARENHSKPSNKKYFHEEFETYLSPEQHKNSENSHFES